MDSSNSKKYLSVPYTPYRFEDELARDLEKDDAIVLEERYRERVLSESSSSSSKPPSSTNPNRKSVKSQTQWTRALDAVQEHFSSHVTLDGVSHKLPPFIYALKQAAKHNWILYKKRECERRKRIRKKIEKEKSNEKTGKPSNVLMAMVDMCEACKRLYVTVNLFWGVTLCDSCYFNPAIINELMSSRSDIANRKIQITPENVVSEVVRYHHTTSSTSISDNEQFFSIHPPTPPPPRTPSPPPPPTKKRKIRTTITTTTTTKKEEEEEVSPLLVIDNIPSPPPTSPGIEPCSTLEKIEVAEGFLSQRDDLFSSSSSSSSEESEEIIHEEGENGTPPSPPPPTPPPTIDIIDLGLTEEELKEIQDDLYNNPPRTSENYYFGYDEEYSQCNLFPFTPNFCPPSTSSQLSYWDFDSTKSRAFAP